MCVATALFAAPAGAQEAPPTEELLLSDAGSDWIPDRCPALDSAAGEITRCFSAAAEPESGWLAVSAVPITEGIDPDVFVSASAAVLGGEPFEVTGLDGARGVIVSVEGSAVTAGVVTAAAGHLFSVLLVHEGDTAAVGDLAVAVARRQHDHVTALVPDDEQAAELDVSSGAAARLDELLLVPEPGSGLIVLTTGDVQADVGGLRPTAGNPRVVDLVADAPGRARILGFEDGTPAAVIVVTEEAYGEFAATALGALDVPAHERFASPALDAVPDAVGFRSSGGAPGVAFRQGRYLVIVSLLDGTADEATAGQVLASLARDQGALLPDGATAPYTFPSTAEGVAVTLALVAGLCGGVIGVGRLASRRHRRRTDPPAAHPTWPPLPGDIADVARRSRDLRRRGLVLALADLVAVCAIVVGVLGVTDVVPMPFAVAVALVASGLVGGTWFSTWWSRSELRRIPGATDAPSAVVASPAGLACGLVALALLVAGTTLVAMGLAGLAFGPGLRDLELARSLHTAPRSLAVGELVVGAGILVLAASAVRLARMWARAGGVRLRARDRRPPILYLRSFEDDALRVATILSARRPFLELFTTRGTDPFEESVTWQVSPYGPVVAVGRPGRSLASLGAARDHLPDDVWRHEVARRMAEARVILVVIGATEGLRWELTQIVAGGHLGRTVFVLPPADPALVRHRWQVTWSALVDAGVALPSLPVAPERALAAVVDPAGVWWVAVDDHRDEASFRVALDEAMGRVAGTSARHQPLTRRPDFPGFGSTTVAPSAAPRSTHGVVRTVAKLQ